MLRRLVATSVEVIVADFSKSLYSPHSPLPRHQLWVLSISFLKCVRPFRSVLFSHSPKGLPAKHAIFGLFDAEHAMISPQDGYPQSHPSTCTINPSGKLEIERVCLANRYVALVWKCFLSVTPFI